MRLSCRGIVAYSRRDPALEGMARPAVIFPAGSSLRLPQSLLDPVRTLPVHFYILAREGISTRNAYGTATVLLLAILSVNFTAYYLLNRFTRRNGHR